MIQHQRQHVMNHIFFICFPKINLKTPQMFFLMLEAKQPKSRGTMNSSSIKLLKETKILIFSFNFK